MAWAIGFVLLCVGLVVWASRKVGTQTLHERELARALPVVRVTRDAPGEGWQSLGAKTTARGLDLKFDHDDDPQAEASIPARHGKPPGGSRMSNTVTVTLWDRFETHHVHTAGFVFRISLRGTGSVIGTKTDLKMLVTSGGEPVCGRIENDDDEQPAAVGDWIEVEWAEILCVNRS